MPDTATTVVDVSKGAAFDVWVGRARKRTTDDRLRVDHPLAKPYMPHDGNPNWREDGLADYREWLRGRFEHADAGIRAQALEAAKACVGKRLGTWGEYGVQVAEVLAEESARLGE